MIIDNACPYPQGDVLVRLWTNGFNHKTVKVVQGSPAERAWLEGRLAAMTPVVARTNDSALLDYLETRGGFVAGMDDGVASVRLLGTSTWHPTLRAAIAYAISMDRLKANL